MSIARDTRRAGIPLSSYPFSVLLPLFLSVFLAFATSSLALLCALVSIYFSEVRHQSAESFALRNLIFFARNISASVSKLEKLILYVTFDFQVHRISDCIVLCRKLLEMRVFARSEYHQFLKSDF